MNVPFMDLVAQYAPIRAEVERALTAVLDTAAFAGGPFVEAFEKDFAAYVGCAHAVGVGNGTDALWLALLALDVGPGDEVITVPNSFFATAEAISLCGAKPIFVDVDPDTLTMSPTALKKAITKRTQAIVPVHLFGQTADMDSILEIADTYGLPIVEDAAQAHGAIYRGRRAGAMGAAGCFSFYPGKNLGAPGEAGAVTTNDEALAARIRMLRDHGQTAKHVHRAIGWNARMDGIHGAVLSVKLRYLDGWNAARRERAAIYRERLAAIRGLKVPTEAADRYHVYHLYALRSDARDELIAMLASHGVQCAIHYPVPIHLQPAYGGEGAPPGGLPIAEASARALVSLPLYPELSLENVHRICDLIEDWAARKGSYNAAEQGDAIRREGAPAILAGGARA